MTNEPPPVGETTTDSALAALVIVAPVVPAFRIVQSYAVMLCPAVSVEAEISATACPAVGVVVCREMPAYTPLTDRTAAWASSIPAPHVDVVQ